MMSQFHTCQLINFLLFVAVIQYFFLKDGHAAPGVFWHITDIHLDQNYSRTGDVNDLCHKSNENESKDNGRFGNFLCETPQKLIYFTIKEMKRIEPNPDFIIWTGDNLPHTTNPLPDWDVVYSNIQNVTKILNDAFPEVHIFPTIGNHDTFPPNLLPSEPTNQSIYDGYLEKGTWNTILPESTWLSFKKGGFYSYSMGNSLRIISLNTILWYETNPLVQNLSDPAGQLQWLEDELQNASSSLEKVYIIGHVPPGFYNRVNNGTLSTPLFHLQFQRSYLSIVKQHSTIILGQMFGHFHNDMFQLHYCDTGVALNSALLAPSVTPWHFQSPISLPVNPAVRLVYFDKEQLLLLNYDQYFLNLTKANNLKEISAVPEYELLYSFTEAYTVPDLSTTSLLLVYERLKSNSTLFQLFFKYLSAAKTSLPCEQDCRLAQLCSMASTSETEYAMCMQKSKYPTTIENGNNSDIKPITYAVVLGCIVILLSGLFIVYNKWCKGKKYDRF